MAVNEITIASGSLAKSLRKPQIQHSWLSHGAHQVSVQNVWLSWDYNYNNCIRRPY
jgi:hypothetical protein